MNLALEAHSRGLLDYSKDDGSIQFYLKEKLLLQKLEKELFLDVLDKNYMRLLALFNMSKTSETITQNYDNLVNLIIDYSSIKMPWLELKNSSKMDKASVLADLTSKWESVFGKLSDPDMQARIAKIKKAAIKTEPVNPINWTYK